LKLGIHPDTVFDGRTALLICFKKLLDIDAGEMTKPILSPDKNATIDFEECLAILMDAKANINAQDCKWDTLYC